MSERTPDHSDDTPAPEGEPPESILGSLPRSRPAVRSPRRDAAQARAARAEKAAASEPAASASAGAEPEEPDSQGGGLEDVARAGVTTAAQVAAAGLRFAGRAAGAIRESLERR